MKMLLLVLILSASIKIGYTQCKYQFIINDKNYFIDETTFNDLFGRAFEEMKEGGIADGRQFQTWVESFDLYKLLACKGVYRWKIYYRRVAEAKYDGEATESELGIYSGKRKNPNKLENSVYRMAQLNYQMQKYLTKYFININVE